MAIKSLNNKMLNVAYLEGAESIVISGDGGGGSDVQIINQSKSVTITENGTTSVTYDSGYTGLSEVNIDVNVASSGGSGDSPFSWDWSQIGYTPENTVLQQQFEDDIAYSKSLAETFTPSKATSHFKNQRRLKFVPMVDTSNVTNMSGMFSYCNALTAIPQLDTSNVTNMSSMFINCTALTTISQLDTSSVTNMGSMFSNCTALTTISQLDTSSVTNMGSMFSSCTALTTISQLDTSSVTDMSNMFYSCTALTAIPQLDTSNVTNMGYMFNNCSALTTIPQLDTSSVTNMSSMFSSCRSLTFILIKNIGKSTLTTFDFSGAKNWGTGSDENRQSLIDSLITYSYDRVTNGMTSATIKLSTNTKALLTEDEIAQITAKGFTIS